jgi:hypothetical protein
MDSSFDASHYIYSREITCSVPCLRSGPNIEISFPGAYFCNECKAYEGDNHAYPMGRRERGPTRDTSAHASIYISTIHQMWEAS